MKIVVVAGQARKVGKTSVAAGLIRSLRHLHWTAVKISLHGPAATHGACLSPGGFELMEETVASGSTDTGRFLAAGARRAFWLRTSPGSLGEALASLFKEIHGVENVLIESGRAMDLIRPRVGLVVTNRTRRATKSRAKSLLARADAVVEVGRARGAGLAPRAREFAMSRKKHIDPALACFVQSRLRRMPDSQICTPREETSCPP